MKKILIHVCCAICGAYLVEFLKQDFEEVLLYFYNPNIHSKDDVSTTDCVGDPAFDDGRNVGEYEKRLESVNQLAEIHGLELIEGEYDPKNWLEKIKGLEEEPEGGRRCPVCFQMRLEKAAIAAQAAGAGYFTTTLAASSFKDEKLIGRLGREIGNKYDLKFIDSFGDPNFKKSALQKARALAKQYNFYHQKYCGCVFSISRKGLPEKLKRL